jgi:predicted cation transporter
VISATLVSLTILAVLLGPILIPSIEHNVELFFLIAGVITAAAMGQLSLPLIRHALHEPIALTSAVLVFGIVFRLGRESLDRLFAEAVRVFSHRWLCFGLTLALGLLAGFITVIVAALIFAEAVALLKLNRDAETAATVFGCFAIGLGGGLTPLGMPASTLVLAALHADFWYLARLLGPFVIAGILLSAGATLLLSTGPGGEPAPPLVSEGDAWMPVLLRTGKVYIFIVGLVGLSAGLRPLVDIWLPRLPEAVLFWLNTLSAVVDNATLAAVEIGPALSIHQQRSALLSLLISGGMLIPGNIPNIVAASRLSISSRAWARYGLVTGAIMLLLGLLALKLLETSHA